MNSVNESEIIIEIITDFQRTVVNQNRDSLVKFKNHLHQWQKGIRDKYQNSNITSAATEVVLNELVHYVNQQNNNPLKNPSTVLIMKGGGIKGLAYVGALEVIEPYYKFDWYAGTSAGAISAILLGSGHTTSELLEILGKKNFNDFKDAGFFKRWFNLVKHLGFYKANTFVQWLEDLLALKLDLTTKVKLSDLKSRVTIYATTKGSDALVFDSHDPATKESSAAFAARCSMSIPIYFVPQQVQGVKVFDGGLRHNFPLYKLLTENSNPNFLGLYLGSEVYKWKSSGYFSDLYEIFLEGGEQEALRNYSENIIIIDPSPISVLDFKLSEKQIQFLLEAGRLGALKFLKKNGFSLKPEEIMDYDARRAKHEIVRNELAQKNLNKKKVKKAIFYFIALLLLGYVFNDTVSNLWNILMKYSHITYYPPFTFKCIY